MEATLDQLIEDLPVRKMDITGDIRPTGIQYDSRQVKPGNVFVAVRGFKWDGHDYLQDAVERGASALVVERADAGHGQIPIIEVNNTRSALAHLAAAFYRHPSRDLQLVGITGTNGKTTTTYLVSAILAIAGMETGLIGTIENRIKNQVLSGDRTTPEAPDLQLLLREMVDAGVQGCAMEVSSHGLSLHRVDCTRFTVGVFTNLSQDHLDFHGSMEEYFAAKERLFALLAEGYNRCGAAGAVINCDDVWGQRLLRSCPVQVLSYGFDPNAYLQAREAIATPSGVQFQVYEGGAPRAQLELGVPGKFSVYNALGAAGVGRALGLDWDVITRGLAEAPRVPGRFEPVEAGQDFAVIVDYAHTPDGLENILRSGRELEPQCLTVVFGCGGARDRAKRPLMGQIAASRADRVVVTSDNPRTEDPEAIIAEIMEGVRKVRNNADGVETIVDRRQAINRAVQMASPGDLVLIAGKGHETTQVFGDRVIPFDDRVAVRQALEELALHEDQAW